MAISCEESIPRLRDTRGNTQTRSLKKDLLRADAIVLQGLRLKPPQAERVARGGAVLRPSPPGSLRGLGDRADS
jgi:hypothetical protein